jgi:hypothetical protein
MATRSEQYRAQAQRHPSKQSKKKSAEHASKKSRVKRKVAGRENVRAGKKATAALEPRPAKARPSRKSSRASANRMKYDTNLELRAERAKKSPESRYRSGK